MGNVDMNLNIGGVFNDDGLLKGVKEAQQKLMNSDDLKIDFLTGGEKGITTNLGDASAFFKEIETGAQSVNKLTVNFKNFKDILTGETFRVPISAVHDLRGEFGEGSIEVKKFNTDMMDLIRGLDTIQETGSKKVSADFGKKTRELNKEIDSMKKGVDSAGDSVEAFNAKSGNMAGKQVEHARDIGASLTKQKEAFDLAYSQKNLEGMKKASDEVRKLEGEFRNAEAATKRGAVGVTKWVENLNRAIKQTAVYTFTIGAMRKAQRELGEAIKYIIDLNTEMTKIQVLQVRGAQTDEEIDRLAQSYNNLAKELGLTTLEVAKGSVEWLRQGKSIEATSELMRSSAMMAKLGNLSTAESTELLTSTLNSFNMEAEEAASVVDKLVQVDNIAATSVKELATALRYSAANANEAGVSLEELISYIAVVSSTTRQNAESIGQGMKTMLARMQDIKAGAIDEDGLGLNNVEIALARIDVPLRDSKDSFRDMSDVLEDVADKWDTLNDIEQANIAKSIAGIRQQNMFLILMQNMDTALEYQKEQTYAAGVAFERYQLYLQSAEAAQNRLKSSIEGLYQGAIKSGLIVTLLDAASAIIEFTDAVGGLQTVLIGLVATMTALKMPAILGFFAKLAEAIWMAKDVSITLIGALQTVGLAVLPWLALAAAITAVVGGIYLAVTAEERHVKQLQKANEAVAESQALLKKEENNLKSTKDAWEEYTDLKEKASRQGGLGVSDSERLVEIQNELYDLMDGDLKGVRDENLNFVIDEAATWLEIEETLKRVIALQKEESEGDLEDQAKTAKKVYKDDQFKAFWARKHADTVTADGDSDEVIAQAMKTASELEEIAAGSYKAYTDLYMGLPKAARENLEKTRKIEDAYRRAAQKEYYESRKQDEIDSIVKEEEVRVKVTLDNKDFFSQMQAVKADMDTLKGYINNLEEGVDVSETIAALKRLDIEVEYLNDGTISAEKGVQGYLDTYREMIEAGVKFTDDQREAFEKLLGGIYTTVEGVEELKGVIFSSAEYEEFSNMTGQAFYNFAEKIRESTGFVFRDQQGLILNTSAAIGSALSNGFIKVKDLIDQLTAAGVTDLNILLSLLGQIGGFTAGTIPYAPTIPSFGGGSSGGGGENPEKKRLEAEIKKQEKKKDALKDTLKEFKRYIDAQKESLKLTKEEAEFNDKIADKNKSLAKLKTEITMLSLDDSEEARARRLELEESAADLEKEIAEDKEDRRYDLQVDALDRMAQNFEDNINKQIDRIDDIIDKHREEVSAIQSVSGATGGAAAAQVDYGSTVDQITDRIISRLEEQKGKLGELRGPISSLINQWLTLGNTQASAYNMALQYYELSRAMATFRANNPDWTGRRIDNTNIGHHYGGLIEEHHDGDFAGNLRSNEVFAKLLQGEYVATEGQMKNFMSNILPKTIGAVSGTTSNITGDTTIDLDINVEGSLDETVLPKLEQSVLKEVNKALKIRGIKRNAGSLSI